MTSGKNILFIVTGSIAAYKACDVVSQLVQRGHRVKTVLTASAKKFIGEATLEGLTGERVYSDLFAPGDALEHIDLDRWADAVVVCPATANTLNRFAAGLGDDVAGALLLAHDRRKPLVIAPAMNPAMWSHPATVAAVRKLTAWGARFIPVGEGRTACGETGEGRLADSETILTAIGEALAPRSPPLRVLITSGGTSEPVDGVRVLTNTSTGRTGAGLATWFAHRGHEVVLLRAENSAAAPECREQTFRSYADLERALRRLLADESFDVVIHAAAVSDFGIDEVLSDGGNVPRNGKLDSEGSLTLKLRPLPKLVTQLRAWSANSEIKVVAFKLTVNASDDEATAAVDRLLDSSAVDFVVHNDLSARSDEENFPSTLYFNDDTPPVHCSTRSHLASSLEHQLSGLRALGVLRG